MHMLSQGSDSASLGGSHPYFLTFLLFFWQVGQANPQRGLVVVSVCSGTEVVGSIPT